MKSRDEIMLGLTMCLSRGQEGHCDKCPYYDIPVGSCQEVLRDATNSLIQQLEAKNAELIEKVEQLKTEGTEAEKLLRLGGCDTCKYRELDGWIEPCIYCENHDRWEMLKGE